VTPWLVVLIVTGMIDSWSEPKRNNRSSAEQAIGYAVSTKSIVEFMSAPHELNVLSRKNGAN